MEDIVRISFEGLSLELERVLLKLKFGEEQAKTCAKIFAENTLVGVNSHGINRFPRFVRYVRDGYVKPDASPLLKNKAGALEQWDGCLGPGPLNAWFCTQRGMELARESGIGCVALANTNHWMRGGWFGWEAAKAGYVFIGWTNTIANMPAWGAVDCRLGNNPLVIGVPFQDEAVVLDMAMSQFSFGAIESHNLKGKALPYPGGYNVAGAFTVDPSEILESRRLLPIGYWKGSGLTLLLDILAVLLSGGKSTSEISSQSVEYAVSQVFILFDLSKLGKQNTVSSSIRNIIDDLHASVRAPGVREVLYPGERILRTREENLRLGVPIDRSVWEEVQSL